MNQASAKKLMRKEIKSYERTGRNERTGSSKEHTRS